MAAALPRDKYYLRSLHEEIALFDRKLAHLMKYETFASEKDRNSAAAKMSVKRGQLIKNAQQLVEEGVEFKNSDLPRSLRADEPETVAAAASESLPDAALLQAGSQEPAAAAAVYDGTILDFRQEIKEYMQNRRKLYAPSN